MVSEADPGERWCSLYIMTQGTQPSPFIKPIGRIPIPSPGKGPASEPPSSRSRMELHSVAAPKDIADIKVI